MAKIKKRKSRGLFRKHTTSKKHKKKTYLPQNPLVKKHWDPSISAIENYSNLGIRTCFEKTPEKEFQQGLLQGCTDKEYKATETKVREWEKQILTNLCNKYSGDYLAMAKDQKLNPWLWSAREIKKKLKAINL